MVGGKDAVLPEFGGIDPDIVALKLSEAETATSGDAEDRTSSHAIVRRGSGVT